MRVLLAAVLAGGAAATAATPLSKVTDLLQNLHDQAIKEKDEERKTFEEFDQDCDGYVQQRQLDADTLETMIEVRNANVEQRNANAAKLKGEINQHGKDVGYWEGDIKATTAVRDAETAQYATDFDDYSTAISAVERAVESLEQGAKDVAAKSLIQIAGLPQLSGSSARQRLISLVNQPDMIYEHKSMGIIDMLQDLRQKFVDERNELENKEKTSSNAYKVLVSDLESRIEDGKTKMKEKREQRTKDLEVAGKEQAAADEDSAMRDTHLASKKKRAATCETTRNEFGRRQKLRAEEIEAIAKALEIIKSEAVSAADKRTRSLLQVQSVSESGLQAVASFLHKQAVARQSTVLEATAALATQGPFDKVIGMIKQMIEKLRRESSEEMGKKGWCDKALRENEVTRNSLTDAACAAHTTIYAKTAEAAQLGDQIAELMDGVANAQESMANATKLRTEQKKENEETIKDAQGGIAAVQKAVEVLKAYFEKNGFTALLQQKPSLADSKNYKDASGFIKDYKEPDLFSSPFEGHGAESGGVIGMLEVVLGDMQRVESETALAEENQANAHSQFLEETDADIKKMTREKENKELAKQEAEQLKDSAEQELASTNEQYELARKEYREALEPQCVSRAIDWEKRAKKRQEEIDDLKSALQIIKDLSA